jgi:dolichyl-phosphate-mannose--protein O-mannosyl transferase
MPIRTGAERIEPKNPLWRWLALAIIILATWLPRGLALDRFVTIDEDLWLYRAANFYFALGQRDFQDTYQSGHPGVTAMWTGTLGWLARYPQYRGSGLGQVNHLAFHRYLEQQSKALPLDLLAASRAFMVLGHTLILALGFWYAARLIGLTPAFIAFLLIAFDPFHLALTRLLHLDGLLANLMLLSLLAFILFLQRRRPLDLLVSAGAAGLSVLTKSPGVLLAPVLACLTCYELWRAWPSQESIKPIKMLWKSAWP